MPFVPRSIVYPKKEVISYINGFGENYRAIRANTIPVDTNMVYRVNFASGYDAVYPLKPQNI